MQHITDSALHGFSSIFLRAVERNFRHGERSPVVRPVAAPTEPLQARLETVLLTSASMRFRLTSVFRVLDPQATHQFYASSDEEAGSSSNPASKLQDQLLEMGNLACGEMNRELLAYFANVALSSPSVLQTTAQYLFRDLRAERVVHYTICLGDVAAIDASLCMTAQAPVDFSHVPSLETVEGGELELL